jgi:ketosteroid isomerase-like protein
MSECRRLAFCPLAANRSRASGRKRDTAQTMSQENVKTLKAAFNAWNANDADDLARYYDPEASIVRGLEGWPESESVIGREAVLSYFAQLRETYDADTMEPIGDFIEVGERVVVRHLWQGTGKGPDLKMEMSIIYTMRKHKVFLMEYFWDHAEALDSLGLRE